MAVGEQIRGKVQSPQQARIPIYEERRVWLRRPLGYLTSNSTKGIDEMSASLGTGGFVNKLNEEAELLDDLVRPVHFYILDGNRTSSMLFIYEHISFSY